MINMFSQLFKNTLYFRISSDWISVRLIEQKRELSDSPFVAFDEKKGIIAIGAEAQKFMDQQNNGIQVLNAFDHPRTIFGSFNVEAATMRYLISKVMSKKIFVRPIMVLHPKYRFEGGLTQIELRALRDLGESAGARLVYIWIGRDLLDDELSKCRFPKQEGALVKVVNDRGHG